MVLKYKRKFLDIFNAFLKLAALNLVFIVNYSYGIGTLEKSVVLPIISSTTLDGDFSKSIIISLDQFEIEKINRELNKLESNGKGIEELIFESDNNVSSKEFQILADFSVGSLFNHQKMVRFLELVQKKKRFKSVRITCFPVKSGIKLTFSFKGAWVIRDLKVHGISLGKDSYRRFYKDEPGDYFSLVNHTSSLAEMVSSLKKRGRCAAKVSDHFWYNNKNKSIVVHAAINKGSRFKISSLVLELIDKEGNEIAEEYKKRLYKKYFSHIIHKKYDEEVIAKRTKLLRDELTREGFTEVVIQLKESVDQDKCTVQLELVCTFYKQHRSIFMGNYFFSSEELSERMSKFGDSIGMLPLSILAQDIKNEYLKKGFFEVKIETREEKNDNYFLIQEGPRALLSGLLIKESSYEQKFLEQQVNFKCTPSVAYDEDALKKSVDSLLSWYQDQGFLEVRILKKSIEESAPDHYIFTLILDEGQKYSYEKIVAPGYDDLIKDQKIFKTGVPFSYKKVHEQRMWLLDHFKKDGYLFVRCVPKINKDTASVTVVWDILLGEQIYFGKAIVRGITRLPYERILKEVAYKEGELWSVQALQDTQERLQKLGIFKQVSVYPDHEDAQNLLNTHRSTIIQLQEEDPFELRVRCGFQQVSKNFGFKKGSTYKIGGSFLWRNPSNNADQFRIDTDFTRFERKFCVAYLFPRTFDVPVSTTFKIYNNKYSQPVSLGHKATLYDAVQQGFLMSFTTTNYRTVSTGCNVGVEFMETKNLSRSLAGTIDFNSNLIGKKIPYFLIEPNLFVDCLDDKLNPRNGFYSVVSLKGMFPFKESSYFIKAMAEYAFFKEIIAGSDVVFGTRVRLGHIYRETFNKIMPPERFYLGGPYSIRGYQPDGCPPLGSFLDNNGVMQWVAKGGKTMINFNFETRFPLLIPPLQGVIFQDLGTLVADPTQVTQFQNGFASTGFGFRYMTPIGPLRFDIGWKWKKAYPGDSRYGWCLTFGHAF